MQWSTEKNLRTHLWTRKHGSTAKDHPSMRLCHCNYQWPLLEFSMSVQETFSKSTKVSMRHYSCRYRISSNINGEIVRCCSRIRFDWSAIRRYRRSTCKWCENDSGIDGNFTVAATADIAEHAFIFSWPILAVNSEWLFETYKNLYIAEPRSSVHRKVPQNCPLMQCELVPPHFPLWRSYEFVLE